MDIEIKTFKELDSITLYNILELRNSVFIVEQNCVYQDIDNKDREALHVIFKKKGKVVAYTRCFAPGLYFKEASIGRVVVLKNQRNNKLWASNNESFTASNFIKLQHKRGHTFCSNIPLKNFTNLTGFIKQEKST